MGHRISAFCVAAPLLSILATSSARAAPLTPGNLLVTQDDIVREFTPAGMLVQTLPVPYGGGGARPATESVRDLVVDALGRIQVYDGTFYPYLSAWAPATGTWSAMTYSEWSTINNLSYGGIATFQGYVFVTDMSTAGGAASGLVRFNLSAGTGTRFANGVDTIDLTMGLDNLLYALTYDEKTVQVYDPSSLALVRTFFLASGCRGIAVNAAGQVFGAAWNGNIYHFDSNGVFVANTSTGTSNLSDIDVAANGNIVVGGRFGDVIQTDETLGSVDKFIVGSATDVFVAFVLATCTDGDPCDDDNPCTTGDTCSSNSCAGTPVICPQTNECLTQTMCDRDTGLCSALLQPDGTTCDDDDACTASSECHAGECIGMAPVICMAVDECHLPGTCDSQSGLCTNPEKSDGATCKGGVCNAGQCELGNSGAGTGGNGGAGGDAGTGGMNGAGAGPVSEGSCDCRVVASPGAQRSIAGSASSLLGIVLLVVRRRAFFSRSRNESENRRRKRSPSLLSRASALLERMA